MASPWSDAESDRLVELHADGNSLHSIAAEMGRSKQTIHRYAKTLGLSFDRTATATAAEAVHQDNRAKRTALESRLLVEADFILDQLWEKALVYSFGGSENEYNEHELEQPTFGDQKAIMQTASTALTAANRLHDMNSDGRDLPAVDAWILHITEGGAE